MIGFSGRYWPQIAEEFGMMMATIQREGVASYLEIGALNGDTVHAVASRLPLPLSVTVVDMENGPGGEPDSGERLGIALDSLASRGVRVSRIIGDSKSDHVVKAASSGAPYDFAFIDGDHSEDGARADWLNYGPMARIVGFHDIDRQEWGVSKVWQEIRADHPNIEIIGRARGAGIGLAWVRP